MCMCSWTYVAESCHTCSIRALLLRLPSIIRAHAVHLTKWQRVLLCIICSNSTNGSMLGLTCLMPLPPGGHVVMVTGMVADDPGIGIVAASETSKLAGSHDPHLQKVTWPLSLTAPRRAIERTVSTVWTVAGRYRLWMKTATLLKHKGREKGRAGKVKLVGW